MLEGFRQLARSWMPQTIADLDRWMDAVEFGMPTRSGYPVDEKSAMQLPAVWACVDLISSAASILPGNVFRRLSGGIQDREKAPGHYLQPFVHDFANPVNSAMEWVRIAVTHLELWGNHYSWIDWYDNNRPRAIYPIAPEYVRTERKSPTARIQYFIRDVNGQWHEFQDWEILHVRGLSLDGHTGLSPIGMMREAVSLVGADQQSTAMLHKNGFTNRLILEHPGTMDQKQQDTFKETFTKAYTGLQNAHKAIVLQNGMTAKAFSINPKDAEFLLTAKYHDSKIYQIYKVPPHMVGDTEKSTSWGTGIEQQTIGFVTFCLLPIMKNLETTLEQRLLPAGSDLFIEYELKGLLRGDTAARSQWHRTMVELGVYSPNDVLKYENEEPYEGGDVFRRPMNTVFVDRAGTVVLSTEPKQEEPANEPTL